MMLADFRFRNADEKISDILLAIDEAARPQEVGLFLGGGSIL
jgi:hypothetical protein